MLLMPANQSGSHFHYLCGRHPGKFAWLVGPSAVSKTALRDWVPFACDNDAFSAYAKGVPWDEAAWLNMLDWVGKSGKEPLWVLVPDKVADREVTLAMWKEYSPAAARLNCNLAFAVQDGMTPEDVPRNANVVFVGGTDEFKWGALKQWTEKFPRVHVGRVNSLAKYKVCEALGCESIDGTGWFRDPADRTKISAVEAHLHACP
jgi:hypothetical protein